MTAERKAAPEVLTPAQVAALLAVDVKTVTRWAQKGRLRSFRTPGGHRRYDGAEVRSFIKWNDQDDQA